MSAVSATDAWAVGADIINGIYRTLAFQWDGTTWSKVRTPNPEHRVTDNVLSAASTVSATDVWAVGSHSGINAGILIEHWNGVSWTQNHESKPGLARLPRRGKRYVGHRRVGGWQLLRVQLHHIWQSH